MQPISNGEPDTNDRSQSQSIFILVVVVLLYVVNYMDRTIISVTLPLIKEDLGFTDTQLGWLGTIYLIMTAVLAVPVAILVDRWSRKKALSLMAMVWSVGTLLTGLGKSFPALMHARGWVGIGEAGYAAGGMAYISGTFRERARARVNGIFVMGAPVGLIMGALVGGYIAKANLWGLGWRAPYYIFAVPGVILGILILFTKDYSTESKSGYSFSREIFSDIRFVCRFKTFWFLTIGFSFCSFSNTSVMQFLPLYFTRSRGWDVTQASTMFGIIFVFAALGSLLAGIIADKWREKHIGGRPLTAGTLTAIGTVSVSIAFVADHSGFFVIGYCCILITAVLAFAVLSPIGSTIMDLSPLKSRSMSLAIYLFIGHMLASPGATVVGWLSDRLGTPGNPNLAAAFSLVPICYFMAAICFFLGARSFGTDYGKATAK